MADDQDVLENLKRDLQDGEDLATAVSLVSDAVQRRIRRVRRSLDLLDPEDQRARAVRRRLSAVLERYQQELDTQSTSLRLIVDEYQPALDDLADRLESEADQSGADQSGADQSGADQSGADQSGDDTSGPEGDGD